MGRNLIYALGMGLVSTAIMAVMIFGVGTAFSVMFLGGMADIYAGMEYPGDGVMILIGIAKIMWSGPVALVSVWLINKLCGVWNWLGMWKVGRV